MGVAGVTKYIPSCSQRKLKQSCISCQYIAAKALHALYIINKTEHFSFSTGSEMFKRRLACSVAVLIVA